MRRSDGYYRLNALYRRQLRKVCRKVKASPEQQDLPTSLTPDVYPESLILPQEKVVMDGTIYPLQDHNWWGLSTEELEDHLPEYAAVICDRDATQECKGSPSRK